MAHSAVLAVLGHFFFRKFQIGVVQSIRTQGVGASHFFKKDRGRFCVFALVLYSVSVKTENRPLSFSVSVKTENRPLSFCLSF